MVRLMFGILRYFTINWSRVRRLKLVFITTHAIYDMVTLLACQRKGTLSFEL